MGNLEGQAIDTVGLAWESLHPGWNTNTDYDDSDAAGWKYAIQNAPQTHSHAIWVDGDHVHGSTPAYFRKKFFLSVAPSLAQLTSGADDDAKIWLNGALAVDDHDGVATEIDNLDVKQYLHQGWNLMAVKAHDSWGAYETFWSHLDIVPEPASLMLLALGSLFAVRRKR